MPRTLAAVLLTLTALPAFGQAREPIIDPPPPKATPRIAMMSHLQLSLDAEQKHIKARAERIKAELGELDRGALKDTDWAREWAGEYYTGDGLGENVTISLAPRGGVAFLNYGCLGLYGGDHGDIAEVLPDGLRLKLRYGDAQQSFLSDRVYFVKWDTERFLVPDWMMTRFVNNYNEGGFARSEMFGIPRLKGHPFAMHQAPRGLPQLPPEYARLLSTKSMKVRIAKAEPLEVRQVTEGVVSQSCIVELASGRKQGVFIGMEFRYPSDAAALSGTITVTEVREQTATALFEAFTAPKDVVPIPKAGDEVSTVAGGAEVEVKEGEPEKKNDGKTPLLK